MVIFLKNVANMVTLALRTPWMLQLTSKFLFFFSGSVLIYVRYSDVLAVVLF